MIREAQLEERGSSHNNRKFPSHWVLFHMALNCSAATDLLLRHRYTTMKRVTLRDMKRNMERKMKRRMRRRMEGTMRIRTMRMRTMRMRTMRMRTRVIRSKFYVFIAQKCAGFSKNATYL
jgi:hypothetical protein